MTNDREAVLITGVFGSGKSTVGAEMAHVLEKRAVPFALLDLDFLAWGYPGADDDEAEHRMMLANLEPVVANYLAVGVTRLVLAHSIRRGSELDSLRATLAMPLKVVRLTAPVEVIERRLRSDPTAGRQDDLRRAIASMEAAEGEGVEDLAIASDRPVREVAMAILEWLGWV